MEYIDKYSKQISGFSYVLYLKLFIFVSIFRLDGGVYPKSPNEELSNRTVFVSVYRKNNIYNPSIRNVMYFIAIIMCNVQVELLT